MSPQIQVILKLSTIFGKYLYQYKTLSLPGIGVFSIDPEINSPEPSDKNLSDFYQHIKFVQQPVLRPDDSLIEFIRQHTGKIRPLAESDLESYLSDGKVLLNIGKPFYFEGIGTIQKNRQGTYDFIPGLPLVDRLAVTQEEVSEEDAQQRFEKQPYRQVPNNTPKQLLVVLAILVGLTAVIWGGYLLYNSNNESEGNGTVPIADSSNIFQQDTAANRPLVDSNSLFSDTATGPGAIASNNLRFVIEQTPNKSRALRRYNQLRNNFQDIRLLTPTDSSLFTLYFEIPAISSDTPRIKDSLRRYYGVSRVFILN